MVSFGSRVTCPFCEKTVSVIECELDFHFFRVNEYCFGSGMAVNLMPGFVCDGV